jgi:hypothetical protein
MSGLVLDTGALIAYERRSKQVELLLMAAIHGEDELVVPAGVVGQAWRDGRRQARLASLLGRPELVIETLDDQRARAAGMLCGVAGTDDVVDASVVLCAMRRKLRIVTSDPDDLAKLDARAQLVVI